MSLPSHDKLYKEAAFVGIALVPMWYAVAQFTTAVRWFSNDTSAQVWKSATDVFLAGALFHLTAEESGLNAHYLSNSFAHDKTFAAEYKKDARTQHLDNAVDWLRDAGTAFGLSPVPQHAHRSPSSW